MPRRRTGRSEGLQANAEINVTSLVDVAFTLLVIFLITAPILQGGVEIKVPKAEAAPIASPEGLTISINRAGEIFIGEAPVSWAEFSDVFPQMVKEKKAETVYVRADEGVPYGEVLKVIGAMKAMDVATVGLVAEPENTPPTRSARR